MAATNELLREKAILTLHTERPVPVDGERYDDSTCAHDGETWPCGSLRGVWRFAPWLKPGLSCWPEWIPTGSGDLIEVCADCRVGVRWWRVLWSNHFDPTRVSSPTREVAN